ncbi:spermatogenesis-associated protein 31D3-like [Hippopotamus amphibius kiboko]|uniref:spermatogenesis-associated protein 31D3-like n=1 Tax=Hippopotamus amphibius kiboko TaxID=575201 RepID=UPI0025926BFF|nr:spermatogenesis-associated protein 31D3-like [Hippopotamus amphibius kiboko]
MEVPPLILIALVEAWETFPRIRAGHEPESYDIDPTTSEAYGRRKKADTMEALGKGQKADQGSSAEPLRASEQRLEPELQDTGYYLRDTDMTVGLRVYALLGQMTSDGEYQRAKRRRKGGTMKGWRACQSEVEEARKVLSLLQSFVLPVSCSPPGQHGDTTRFRQLLCPDSSCEVCNNATAEVNRLLFPEALEDATSSVSPLASTAPVTESSFTLSPAFSAVSPGDLTPASLPEPSPLPPSVLSPNPMTPLVDFFAPSPLGHSLAPEPFPSLDSEFPVDYSPPKSLAFPPLLPHDTQTADPVLPPEATLSLNTIFSLDPTLSQDINPLSELSQAMNPPDSFACHHAPPTPSVSPQPDCTLPVTQPKSVSILQKPVLEKSSPDSPGGLSTCVSTIRGTEHSSLSISDFSLWQAHAKNMFLPTLSTSDCQREHVSLHLPDTCLWGDSVTKHMEANSQSFFGFNIQGLLERQIKKRMAFQSLEKKEKEEGPFSKQMCSEYQWTSSGNSLQSLDVKDTTGPQTGWNGESKPEQLRICQQQLYVKTLRENFQQKYSQLFWGLPSLHSESLVATLLVSSRSSPLESRVVLFNGICNASAVKMWDQESPPLFHSHPPPLPHVHPQPLPQTKPQSQPLPFTQVQPQAHLQSRLRILPSSSPSQIRDRGVSFHRFQNESDFNIATENQHLEWQGLQKQQEGLWGLVPVLQKSQEATCPRALNLPSLNGSSHAYVPVSILPGHFHIASELQEKLELLVPRRLIPRWCILACRNLESLTLMEPQYKLTEVPQQRGRHVHLQLSELQGQDSKNVGKPELGLPGNFYERVPTKFQLRNDMRKNLGYILEKSPEDSPQEVSECYLVQGLRAALETKTNCVCHSRHHSGSELLNVSRKDIDWNQIKTILRLHVSTKSWQISAGRIPIGVCRSWLADDNTLPPPGSSQTNMEDTNSKNTVLGKVYCQISTVELSFLDPNTQKVLEAHILRFRVTQRWGLPLKVLESIKFYMLREAKTWPLPQFDFPSSTIHISGVDSKGEVSKLLEGSSKTSQGNKVRTTNSVPMLDHPLPVISSVGKEEQGDPQTSHSDNDQKLAEDVQTIEHSTQTFQPFTQRNKDKVSQSETLLGNRCSPEVPIRQAGDGHEPRDENMSSSDRVERIRGQKTVGKNLEHSFMSSVSREIFKAKELCALKSQFCDILTTSELESSPMTNVNVNKVETTLTTQCPSPRISVPQDSKVDLQKQPLSKLKFKSESKEHSQAEHCPTDKPLTSGSLPSKSSLTHAQGVSTRDMTASHLEDSRTSIEQRQDPSKRVLWKCQDKNFPPAAKRVRPLGSKAGEYRSEDSGAGTSTGRKKSHPVEERELKDTSPSLSQNEQLPPESYFRKKMRRFFQWIDFKRKIKDQESPQQKAKFMSTFVQHQDSAESAANFVSYGPPEAQELMTAIGKILEEKLARRIESEVLELSQHKKELQTQVEPDKGHPSNCGALSDPQQEEWTSIKSSNQEAVSADQSCLTSVRQNRDRIRHPEEVVAFED